MPPALKSMVSVAYVRNIDAARSLYELLGFRQQSAGEAETAAWVVMSHGEYLVLLGTTSPPFELPSLPLLFYFFFDDLEAALHPLESADIEVTRLGRGPHALGGEARIVDPDGNTILLGQREPNATQSVDDEAGMSRFSLLREAAAAVAARGGAPATCQIPDSQTQQCPQPAEVRLADSAGSTVWACIGHADEVLVTVTGAFVADDGSAGGIREFLASRREAGS